ncbi:alpha/beta-hydrolase [Auricularia subglabra TFB-10046 SS5]|nr:alpha/beta-hydrolase [Auricularia subglabra TFB-10046 SS5]
MHLWTALLAVPSAHAFNPLVQRQGPNPPPFFDWYAIGRILDVSHPSPPGTIIVNPGGPGGAGTQFILGNGPSLATLFGPSFDVLVFDPRGTGASTPLARCFSSPQESDSWHLADVKILRSHDGSIPEARSRDRTLSAVCQSALGGNGEEKPGASADQWGIGRFVDSASVATDMLRIVEKLGQEKLQYYGLSYGTLLGQYFAAIYPDKVGRMILDGVVDGVSWQSGTYFDSIKDADGVMDAFFANCVKAGASKCAIWEQSADAVSRRLDRILAAVRRDPLPVPDGLGGPTVVTEDAVLGPIMSRLRITCGAWKIRAKARFTRPVSAKLDAPVLVLSSAVDPVTPLSAARAVVSRFQGMHLLEQNSVSRNCPSLKSSCFDKLKPLGNIASNGEQCAHHNLPLDYSSPGPRLRLHRARFRLMENSHWRGQKRPKFCTEPPELCRRGE